MLIRQHVLYPYRLEIRSSIFRNFIWGMLLLLADVYDYILYYNVRKNEEYIYNLTTYAKSIMCMKY